MSITHKPDDPRRTDSPLVPQTEKRAPVQGFSAGIPWAMHLRAYDVYCKKWGKQDALIDLAGKNCRGGFSVGELDDFIPGWRDELSELTAARATIARLSAEHGAMRRGEARAELALGETMAQLVSANATIARMSAELETAREALGFIAREKATPDARQVVNSYEAVARAALAKLAATKGDAT